ncbi:hypothetical protein [Thauera sinica]|uniref:Type II toxin-antitoxin system RelE/ParE family toxin n=1 Tax=Thauera sinica TaxID=2665146 RepID=A0ABW1APT0_9RHOO|nr:hypothetical protein [Thauera sp. K11]
MNHRVVFSPEAQEQLAELFRYIAEAASPDRRGTGAGRVLLGPSNS